VYTLVAVADVSRDQPLYTFTSDGEVETGGINHVYAPNIPGLSYFGYGELSTLPYKHL
jgi:hypothetical protein